MCSKLCFHQSKTFCLSNEKTNFNKARRKCQQKGGTLAKNLTKSAYEALLLCHSDFQQYWIGLKNVAAHFCPAESQSFQWIGQRECHNSAPLSVQRQPINNGDCRAVAIFTRSLDQNRSIPKAETHNCNAWYYYICESKTGFSLTKGHSNTISSRGRTSSSSHNNVDKNLSSANIGAVVGGILIFVLILTFLFATFLNQKKKKRRNNNQSTKIYENIKSSSNEGKSFHDVEPKYE